MIHDDVISTPLAHEEHCPSCGVLLEMVTGNGVPEPGTITLCAYCLVFLVFADASRQRVLTDAEWLALPADRRGLLTGLRDHFAAPMRITGEPGSRAVWIDDRPLSPARSQAAWNHSPDGFGYEGSGPAQLALAILLAAGLPKARAIELHQQFKREILAPLPQGRRFAIEVDVAAWAARHNAEGDDAPTFAIERVDGVEAIRCLLCDSISVHPGDVANGYCGRCHLFHDAVAAGRQLIAADGVHECHEWPTARDVCALCGAPIARADDAR